MESKGNVVVREARADMASFNDVDEYGEQSHSRIAIPSIVEIYRILT